MPDNIVRTKGRGSGYKFDRGGTPTEFGPFVGVVKNNIDPTRSGRLQVFIRQFAGDNETDQSLWRTVSYIPPFYGSTQHSGTGVGVGTFTGNQQSYGMWFTPPDLGVSVICFFVEGDPNQGYYLGVVPDTGINHMIPAIGASRRFELSGQGQDRYLAQATQLPVTEINVDNPAIAENPRFFDQPKPIHSVVAGILMQQGLITDNIRGPITSNSQRESPSAVFGISTPGRAIYQGGLGEADIKGQLESGSIRPQDVTVIGRRGGHTLVMDDGDLEGRDNLVRIRTSKGHQITMSDDGDCFYIIHANGQAWIELGKQGTVDVFSTNSVNVRTQGTINLHADKDINMFAGGDINMKSKTMKLQSEVSTDMIANGGLTLYSKVRIGVRSDGTLTLKSLQSGGWDGGGGLNLKAGCINLNSGPAGTVATPRPLVDLRLADTVFDPQSGWRVDPGKLPTIVTRAPTHEPYPYHNQGVSNVTALAADITSPLSATAAGTLSGLTNVLPTGAIDVAAVLNQGAAAIPVGTLNTGEVTGLLAQASAAVNQPFNAISADLGVGKFGLSATQLETAGFIKPGTVQQFLAGDPSQLTSVLSSPAVWTGRDGVNGLGSLLGDPKLQDLVQQEVMVTALGGLQRAGVVTGTESPADLAPFVQVAAKYGVDTAAAWTQGRAPANLITDINGLAKGAQYAVNFVDTKLPDLVNTGVQLGGFVDTTQRSSVDQAVASIIDNAKIPTPSFGQSLYASTPNQELTYTGDDPIVWDRVNQERLRRGLSPLPNPRPPFNI